MPASSAGLPPLIVHVVHRFAVGGLENGVVNLINGMPAERWRHAVVSLTDIDNVFAQRITRPDVTLVALNKPPGQGIWHLPRWSRELNRLRPAVVHTRNLAALEMQPAAWLAGVQARIHGEHGRDTDDPHGTSRKHILMRRMFKPFVHHWIALGRELTDYTRQRVGVPSARLHSIYNGVDTSRFSPAVERQPLAGCPFTDQALWLVGTVGRMQTVKAQPLLVKAFILALRQQPNLCERLRLILVGGGPLEAECLELLRGAGLSHLAWLAGERSDVSDVMRGLDCFVLPSLAEGISNTILEAMASGLPVLATDVGANAELVQDGVTGLLVPPGDVEAMVQSLQVLAADRALSKAKGDAGRQVVEQRFSLESMIAGYERVYELALRLQAGQPGVN